MFRYLEAMDQLVHPGTGRVGDRQLWLFWALMLLIVSMVHCLTLSISPTIWQDEVQILDYGRSALTPHTDWSITWNYELNRPVFSFSYLANVLQEIALRLTRFSVIGPRIVTLVGALVAATVTLGWLLARRVNPRVAWLVSLIFLLDPMFVQSYRGGRVDCWVFAACLGACWLVRAAQTRAAAYQQSCYGLVALAGSLGVAAIFIWPSAVFLYPLICLELGCLLRQPQSLNPGSRLPHLMVFCGGAILTGALLWLPIGQRAGAALRDIYALSTTSGGVGHSGGSIGTYLKTVFSTRLVDLGLSFKVSPFLPLATLGSLFYRRQTGLLCTALFAIALVLNTSVYIFRVIYLLPYCVVLVSSLYEPPTRQPKSIAQQRWLKTGLLLLLLGWSFSLSILMRPAVALGQATGRNPQILTDVATAEMGAGEPRVFLLGAIEFYHAGRKLNWKMFWQYLHSPTSYLEILDKPAYQDIFERLDYLILPQGAMTPQLEQAMDKAGLDHLITILQPTPDLVKTDHSPFKPTQSYGPYIVFRRSA